MKNVNKTLYIPLYGKAYVSKKGLFLEDKKAEEIWEAEAFPLKGKSKSKWLAYYMGIRAAVFDEWVKQQTSLSQDAVVLHIGCGMDSRALRVRSTHKWYDIDFPEVIQERKHYYTDFENYQMFASDIRNKNWLEYIPENQCAIVIMEGVSMYLSPEDLHAFTTSLSQRFKQVLLLMDCYTTFAAKMSKYKNPINDVGVTTVYGIDDPKALQTDTLTFIKEHSMTPQQYINELKGFEKFIFKKLYAGSFASRLYRLFEYQKV